MASHFVNNILEAFPLDNWKERRVCLAVSGGADSIALFCSMADLAEQFGLKKNLFVVTVDHCLRGKESTDDALFVERLAQKFEIEVFMRRVDVARMYSEARRLGSLEDAAREERYRLLIETAKQNSARFLLLAHHRDDQLETLLFRLFRGVGLEGLRGIYAARPIDESLLLVRPMLRLSRNDVLAYLQTLNQSYRTDSSNSSHEYLRNRIRNELIPLLNQLFPDKWQGALFRLSELANRAEEHFSTETLQLESNISKAIVNRERFQRVLRNLNAYSQEEKKNNRIEIPRSPLCEADNEIVIRFFRKLWFKQNWSLRDMGSEEWRRLTNAVRAGKKTNQFPDNIQLTFPDAETICLEKLAF